MDHSESVMTRHAELEHEKLLHSKQHARDNVIKEKHAIEMHEKHIEQLKDAAMCIEDRLRHVRENKEEIDWESERRRREMFEDERRGEEEADVRREEVMKRIIEKQKMLQ